MIASIGQAIGVLPFIALGIFAAGLGVAPAIWVFQQISAMGEGHATWLQYVANGLASAVAFYAFGMSLIFVAGFLNFILGGRLKAWRGSNVSWGCVPWYIHATLTLIPRYAFLEFVTPTEFNKLYYRLMGMKIGRNVAINSTHIADPSMITMEDNVTIGGSASIMAHYSQGGYLVLSPVVIKRGATIGLRAILMGGVEVGEKAKVLANSFVLPNTKIPAGETWAGIPAVKIDLKKTEKAREREAATV